MYISRYFSSSFLSTQIGLLWIALLISPIFCLGFLCRFAHDCTKATKVCHFLYLRFLDLYGILWNTQGTQGTFQIHVCLGSNAIYHHLYWEHDGHTLLDVHQGRHSGLCPSPFRIGGPTGRTLVVFGQFSAGRDHGPSTRLESNLYHSPTNTQGMLSTTGHVYYPMCQTHGWAINIERPLSILYQGSGNEKKSSSLWNCSSSSSSSYSGWCRERLVIKE